MEMRKQEKLAEWHIACEAVRKQKVDAQTAKTRAEVEYANAGTQQEAERAERTIKEATAALKVRCTKAWGGLLPPFCGPGSTGACGGLLFPFTGLGSTGEGGV